MARPFDKTRLLEIAIHGGALLGVSDLHRGAYSGKETYLFRNSGTYEIPVWDEVPRVRNVAITDGPALADVEFHGAGNTSMIPGYKQFNGSLEYVRKVSADTTYDALKASQEAGEIEDWVQLNGPLSVDGSAGWRAPIILGEAAETANGGDPVVANFPIGKADAYDSSEVEIGKVPVVVAGGVPTFGALAVLAARAIMAQVPAKERTARAGAVASAVADIVANGFQTAGGVFLKQPPADYAPPGLQATK